MDVGPGPKPRKLVFSENGAVSTWAACRPSDIQSRTDLESGQRDRDQVELRGHWANLETMQAPEAWKRGLTGQGVGVAVIDSGTDCHQSFAGRIVAQRSFVDGAGDTQDLKGHGTLMNGVIAGWGPMGRFPGVAPEASLIVLKASDMGQPLRPERVAKAIDWAIENRQRYNIQVLNLSCNFSPRHYAPDQLASLEAALERAAQVGIIPVAGAGHDGREAPAPLGLPAAAPSAVAVANQECASSTDPNEHSLADTSHRCADDLGKTPSAAAPGTGWLQAQTNPWSSEYAHHTYVVLPGTSGGTSTATAAMSGAVALWKQAYPELTAGQVQQLLQETAQPIPHSTHIVQGAGSVRILDGLDWLGQRSGT